MRKHFFEADAIALQADIDRLGAWSEDWLLRLNIDKCKVMHVHGRGHGAKKKSSHVYSMAGANGERHVLAETLLERDLGVLVSPTLKWHDQTEAAVTKANRMFGMLKKTFSSRSPKLWRGLLLQYIRPHLEFATQAWSPQFRVDIDALEKVQGRVTKCISSLKRLPYAERLERLNLTSLEDRRLRGDLIQQYKIAHGHDHVKFHVPQPLRDARLRGDGHAYMLVEPVKQCITQREHSFARRIVIPWNVLPPECVMGDFDVNGFKNRYDRLHFNRII